jgi:hypothetical protein
VKRFAIAVARVVIKAAVVAAAGLFAMLYLVACIATIGVAGPVGLGAVVVVTLILGFALLREDRQRSRGR